MKILSALFSLFCIGCLVIFLTVSGLVFHYGNGLPNYMQLADYQPLVTTRLYTEDGRLLAEYATEKRVFVPVQSIPLRLKQAFISAEDKRFYTHKGVDPIGITRAVVTNLHYFGRRMQGASTITQQVAKNFLLSSERSFSRKIKEAILAMRIEKNFTKEHILELYLNEIFLGYQSYGVASAALNYFDKSLEELTLGEQAFLAALPKAPNNYHPVRHKDRAIKRRNWVLERMCEDGYISEEERQQASLEDLIINPRGKEEMVADSEYFSEEVRRQVANSFGDEALYNAGFSIRTSLNPDLQELATQALKNGLLKHDKKHGYRGVLASYPEDTLPEEALKKTPFPPYLAEDFEKAVITGTEEERLLIALDEGRTGYIPIKYFKWAFNDKKHTDFHVGDVILVKAVHSHADEVYSLEQYPEANGSMVVLDPHTGRVLAMVGGFSFKQSQFNRAVQALRQPGSSFKPFIYMAALDSGYTPTSLILDAPLVMDQGKGQPKWKPKNYSKIFYGPTTLRIGLEKSRNLMTVRLAQAIGMKKVAEYAKKFGITSNMAMGLSSSLGTSETTLMQLVTAYGMIVNGGKKIEPSLIDRIQDRTGKTIYKQDKRECSDCVGDNVSPDKKPAVIEHAEQVEDPVTAYQMVNILTGVVERGSGRVAKMKGVVLAGKTGTSTDNKDAWFVGFSPDLVVGVQIGHDIPKSLGKRDTGGAVAAPVFAEFMRKVMAEKPAVPFRVPQGIKFVRVNYRSGKVASATDKNVITEAFREETDLSETTPVVGGAEIEEEEEDLPAVGGLY